jgi:pSer/pThr/pTyr-binding forkhead associated (FHA) protein
MNTLSDPAKLPTQHASPEAAELALDQIIDRFFIFDQLWSDLAEKPVGPALIYRIPGQTEAQCFLLDADEISIGRLPKSLDAERGCDLAFPDAPELSRRHCVITRMEDEFILEDRSSTSGTFVNTSSDRLTQPRRLVSGDIIYMGGIILIPSGI